jgi:hypothetical protein
VKFVSLGFEKNLDLAVVDLAKPDSILVFPTRIAANRASASLNRNWDLEARLFLSMEDLRDCLILPQAPMLTDEKRLLCLYLVMNEEQREFFHILNYADIVDWGKRFFDFFEELAEECISPETLSGLGESGTFHLQEWQEIYLDQIQSIRSAYKNYISALGFTDRIFSFTADRIRIPWLNKDIIYVNQYYFSALERSQLIALEEAGNRVTLVAQGLEFASAETLKMQEFDLKTAWQKLQVKPEIKIVETANETQMALAFLAWKQKNASATGIIIDSSFHRKSYSRYFQNRGISLSGNYPFCECGVYRMLELVSTALRSVLDRGGFLPVSLVSKSLSCSFFIRYFLGNGNEEEIERLSHELLHEMGGFLQCDHLYVDEALFKNQPDSPLKTVVLGFFKLMEAFSRVHSIADIIGLIDSPDGIILNRLISNYEREYTDLEAVFWERMANFNAIESLGLIITWEQVFPANEVGQNLLELLLSYLNSARLSYLRSEKEPCNWELGNLLDSRNRSFSSVVVLNMVEGILPSAPTPVWLFSEAQRAKLGLKTYADIRAWERYYFFRLLLTSGQSLCFSYSNLERDVSPSSFLGELSQLLHNWKSGSEIVHKVQIPLSELYRSCFRTDLVPIAEKAECCFNKKLPAEYFVIPSDPESDLKNHTLSVGASGLIQLLKNPFIWYLEYYSKLKRLDWEAVETISNKLFGNLMHAYFATTLGELKGEHDSHDSLQKVFGDSSRLEAELQKLIASPAMRYQIPRNYNQEFLKDIIAGQLSESLFQFYENWLKSRLSRRSFILIPEENELSPEEFGYKPLGTVILDGCEYRLAIRGRADLRIELENSVLIVDFKTGGHDSRQLAIYEWFYYLIDDLVPEDQVQSIFWNILEEKKTEGYKPDKRRKMKADILDSFLSCLKTGYGQGIKSIDRARLKEITRADLFVSGKEEVESD